MIAPHFRLTKMAAGIVLVAAAALPSACNREPMAPSSTAPATPATTIPARSTSPNIEANDLFYLRTAGDPQLSPDGTRALFTVQYADRTGPPYTRIWMADLSGGSAKPWGEGEGREGSAPRWAPDGKRVAYAGRVGEGKSGIVLANADASGASMLTETSSTNAPLPQIGERFAWSPDGTQIAFISSTPGPEPEMEADPIIISRYWYRPASGWGGRFNDNRRLHIFVINVADKVARQLTDGTTYEHSIDWSPDGKELVFLSNHEPDPDFTNNYDLFAIHVESKAVRQLTQTKNNEYGPSWSHDGKMIAYSGLKRPMTSSETNMEDTHVWTLDPATGTRTEVGLPVDNRQGRPKWSPDNKWLYFTVQSRGNVGLYRMPAAGGAPERIGPSVEARGTVGAFDVAKDGSVLAVMSTPSAPADLVLFKPGPDGAAPASIPLTALNRELLGAKKVAETESVVFNSFDGKEIEAFLTKPPGLDSTAPASHGMILMIHGGPHGQQGPAFLHKAQSYAGHGWATLQVNYRGSTGYGQAFSNAIARDQDGGEAKDILAAVEATLRKHPWIDRNRMGVEGGSYGGQLTNWLVTQTTEFKAAIPWASISNIVTQNYLSVYHDYLQQEYGTKPHLGGVMDMLWERSAIRFVHQVKTPMMLSHGDNDLLVNPVEIEMFYIALKDVGVETIMLRYPREGHGMRETQHIADFIVRSTAWYDKHFTATPVAAAP